MQPKWGQVCEFCRKQRYRETRTDHFHYVKPLPDRSSSGTMVSFGADGEEIASARWTLVWKRQLRLASEDEFWKGLQGGPVRYAIPAEPEAPKPLPDYLDRFLRDTLHLPSEEIAPIITRDQAQQLLNDFYSRELRH